jgi:hypothetical protein
MSRSKRKTPICGFTTAHSEKWHKQKTNRRLRHAIKLRIIAGKELMPTIKQMGDIWNFAKDGKQYLGKDAHNKYPDCMRK